jgi:adenosine kinase
MKIVITGSVAFDYLMTFPGYFRDQILPDRLESISLSFLVDSMTREHGGIAPNIAYTLGLLGEHPRLLATVGEDFAEYRTWLESKGVDTSGLSVVPGTFTASFFATTDRANAQIASFFPGAMAYAASLSLRNLPGELPDLVVISPNDPAAMEKHISECIELQIPYLYDPSQQVLRFDGEALKKGIVNAYAMFVNDYEFGLIQKKTGMDEATLLSQVRLLVVTRGEQGSAIYVNGNKYQVPVIPPEKIVDPTGVGDAYRGGFLAGLAHQLDWVTCGMMGAMAATYCLEHKGTQKHTYTPADFVQRLRLVYDDQGKLDYLLNQETTQQSLVNF